MKFRDPTTGDVYSSITPAWEAFCAGLKDACPACPLTASKTGRNFMCNEFVVECETEAARLMGLEVVEDTVTGVTQGVKSLFCEQIGVLPGKPFIVHSYPYRNYPPMVYGEDGCVRLYSPDVQKRHKVGGRAITWIVDHPESVEPCKGYAPQEAAFKKEEPMEKKEMLRICQVLGVEVDQPFNINYPCRAYNCLVVRPDGKVWETGPYPHKIGNNALYYLIEHKDEIIRRPRFTREEVGVLRILYAAGARWLARGEKHLRWYARKPFQRQEDGKWDMEGDWGAMSGKLPANMFPSLRPGQAVALEEIVG